MKKACAILWMILLLFCGMSFAEAASSYLCEVASLGCTILCPPDLFAIYEGMSDGELNSVGISREKAEEILDAYDLEFVAFNKDDSFEVQICKYDAAMDLRLKDKDDSFLNVYLTAYILSLETDSGIPVSSSGLFRTEDNVYIRYEWCTGEGDDQDDVITYYTMMDGLAYEINCYCRETIEDEEARMAETLINNTVWDFDLLAAQKEERQNYD